MSTYQQTLSFLFEQLPMYQRDGAKAYKKDLNNTIALCNKLGNPEKQFKSIHIAGTNGKGSTAHILSAILQTAGYKTALHTSPHLRDFRERIKINGNLIAEKAVIDFVASNKQIIDELSPSFFELTVAMAFDYFAKEQVDIAIIETGMGGRLDSTNILNPILSIITNIGFDHTQFLGDTLEAIAQEKAGIIKPNIPIIIGEALENTKPIFEQIAKQQHAPIIFAEAEINQSYESDLKGNYQTKNLHTALIAIKQIQQLGFNITNDNISKALKNVAEISGLQGRWQILNRNPLTICDCGHNKEGLSYVLEQIKQTPHKQLHFVLGMVDDKDHDAILSILPKNASYYFCKPKIPRGFDADKLKEKAAQYNLNGIAYTSVKDAFNAAIQQAKNDDLVFVGGSTFVMAEVL